MAELALVTADEAGEKLRTLRMVRDAFVFRRNCSAASAGPATGKSMGAGQGGHEGGAPCAPQFILDEICGVADLHAAALASTGSSAGRATAMPLSLEEHADVDRCTLLLSS